MNNKNNYFDFLKYLTKWIINDDDYNKLNNFIKILKINEDSIIPKTLTYLYKHPHLIWYFNKYINNLFDISNFSIRDIMEFIKILIKTNNIKNSNELYFLKSDLNKDKDRKVIKNIFYNYYKIIYDEKLNNIELNYMLNLFKLGTITQKNINDMNKIINGNDVMDLSFQYQQINNTEINSTINMEEFEKYFNENRNKKLPENISNFINELKTKKNNKQSCNKCKLFEKQMIILDTNMEDFGAVDVAFIALNPGKDDIIFDKPLVGKAGKFHRKFMYEMPQNTKWLITNILLCNTNNQKEIGKNDDEILKETQKCTENLREILNKFPAYYYVLIGTPVMKLFGIKGSIIQLSGSIITLNNTKFIVMPHPSSVIQYYGDRETAYKLSFDLIYKILNEKNSNVIQSNNETKQNNTINENNNCMINEITDDLTLVNIITLDDKNILFVFIDKFGAKKYFKKEFKIPVYIRDKDWTDCNMIENEFNIVSHTNSSYQRTKLLNLLRENIDVEKKFCTINNEEIKNVDNN